MQAFSFSKTILVGVFFLHICPNLSGQYKELFVPAIPQIHNSWCWVASMEMIMKFHNPALEPSLTYFQPIIFEKYAKIRGWTELKNCTYCSSTETFPIKVNPGYGLNCSSLFTMESSTSWGICTDYIDQLFHSFGYQSSQQINFNDAPISWESLVKQIDECRPFIVYLDPSSSSGITSNHYMVVKGYFINALEVKYLIANDPKRPCTTNTTINSTIFPYTNFSATRGGSLSGFGINVDNVMSIAGNIRPDKVYPNSADNCQSCDEASLARGGSLCFTTDRPDALSARGNVRSGIGGAEFLEVSDTGKIESQRDPLFSLVYKNAKDVAGFEVNILDSLAPFLDREKYFGANVDYISVEKLAKCFIFHTPNSVAENLDHKEEVIDLVSGGVDTNLVSTFQKNKEGKWVLKKISNYTTLKDRIGIDLNRPNSTNRLTLSNSKNKNNGDITYRLIKFPPFLFEFYAFEYNDVNFMSPADSYPDLKLDRGIGYTEKSVMHALRGVANNYLNQSRRELKFDIKLQKSRYKSFTAIKGK